MSLTTKSIATVTICAAVLMGSFAFATPAKADMLSDLQAQVQMLLAQISALQGGTPVVGGSCNTFTRNHQMGDTGGEVKWIQQFLNKNGAQIAASGVGSPGNETEYFGALTRAAIAKFQTANGITPAAGYWGPITRAKANSMCTGGGVPGVPGVPMSGNGLKVTLAPGSPNNTALVQGQAIGELARFWFQNPTGAPITVTSLGFNRIGVSSDSTLANVYVYQGATRLTDSGSLSNTAFSFNDTGGIFVVPAGGSIEVSVRSDITTGTSGQQVGVALVTVGASGTMDSSQVFPVNGGIQTISSAALGTVVFTYTGPTSASENPGTDVRVFEASTVIGTHAAWLQSIAFENRGSVDADDVKNYRLYIDGTQVGNAVAMQDGNDRITFDLSAAPKRLETGTRIIKVVADVVGGSGETYDIQIRRAADLRAVDVELGQPILATEVGGFPVSAAAANSVGAASLSVVKAASSPTSNVAVGASNVVWAKYEFRASGDNVKVEAVTLWVDQTAAAGMDNVKVFLNGVQVGSTRDIVADTDPDNDGTEFTFGSSFIARQGQTEIVEIYGDAKTAAGTNFASGTAVDIGLSIAAANTEGMDSGDAVSAITETEGNSITVTSSTATVTKYSGYGNQTLVAGANNQRMGSFTLSAGSTEGVNVNTINLTLSASEAASVTDLMLKRNDTGAQLGSTKVSPATGANSFSVNLSIPQSGTVTIDIYANVKSGIVAGAGEYEVAGSGTGAVTATSVPFPATGTLALQTITITGSGSLTVTRDPGTPVNSNVIAGSSMVHVGKFDFAALSSSFTVQELRVKIPSDAATSVSNVTLKYKNSAGVEQTVSQALALPTAPETHATATFTGLTFYVPNNDSADVDVYVDTPTVTSGAKSGAAVSVAIDANEGFKAIDSGGSQATSYTTEKASNDSSGYGTKYVKKTVPTLTRLTTGYTSNTVATGVGLYRFTMTADAAGAVDWREISLTVTTSGGATLGFTSLQLYDVTGTAVQIGATVTALASNGNLSFCATSPVTCITGDTAEQIGAGSSKTYEVRATVANWATSGNSIAFSFAEDASAIANAVALGLHSGQNLVWSDRSANSHTTATADWTNGYLVKDVDNDTRSCQYGTQTTCTP